MPATPELSLPTGPTRAQFKAVHDNAALFAERLGGRHLWSKQREVLETVSRHQRVAVASCHSIGKSFLACWALLWFLYTRNPSRIVTTAPTWNQVEKVIWAYVAREYGRLPKALRDAARLLKTQLVVSETHEAFGRSTDQPDAFQGIHSPHIMLIVDEAAGVDDAIFEAAATLGAGGEYRELLIGNPTNPSGKFYRAFNNPELGYECLRIDALDTPNFTGEACPPELLRELIQPAQVRQWAADWGEDSPAYRSRVHALFPDAGEETVICPLAWFDAARNRAVEKTSEPLVQLGVDVARFGADRSVIAVRVGYELAALEPYQGLDTRELSIKVREQAELWHRKTSRPVHVAIDETGVGSGVVDNCKPHSDSRIEYRGVNFGAAARDAGKFQNLRAEMYWNMRELIRTGNTEPDIAVTATGPQVDRLGSQLAAIRYKYTGTEKVAVERKEEMRERGLPSPDEADAVALAFLPPQGNHGAPLVVIKPRQAPRRY